MDCNQPIDVMLCTTKEFQMFLMVHPYGYRELNNINIISYVIIKLLKFGSLYTKAIKMWQRNTATGKKIWANFSQNFIENM